MSKANSNPDSVSPAPDRPAADLFATDMFGAGQPDTGLAPGAADKLFTQLSALFSATEADSGTDGQTQAGAPLVRLALDALASRPAGSHRLLVSQTGGQADNQTDEDSGPLLVAIATDDMPYLVDSAIAVISRHAIEIRNLFHPILVVRRDDAGRLTGFDTADDQPVSAAAVSLLAMELEAVPAQLRATLSAELDLCYRDARLVADDQAAMQTQLEALRCDPHGTLPAHPPPADSATADASATDKDETCAFLDWLSDGNFHLLGLASADAQKGTQLGILRDEDRWLLPSTQHSADPVVIHTARQFSTLLSHRPLDIISIRRFGTAASGQPAVVSETHLLGLFTDAALQTHPGHIPLIRRKVADARRQLGYRPSGHAGRMLDRVMEKFPREELFRISTDALRDMAKGLLSLLDRPRPLLFANHDPHGDKALILVYIPRDSYSADMRNRIGRMLASGIGGHISQVDVELRADPLARIHYMLDDVVSKPDAAELNRQLLILTRGWEDRLEASLAATVGASRAAALRHGYRFGPRYQAACTSEEGAVDLLHIAGLAEQGGRHVALSRRADDGDTVIRVKILQQDALIELSDSVPMLENFGFRVIEELPYLITGDRDVWLHDQLLQAPLPVTDFEPFAERLNPALAAVLAGTQENDPFNALITSCGLSAEEANWLRAWFRYARQTGSSHGVQTIVDALKRNGATTRALVARFRARHDPALAGNASTDSAADDAALQEAFAGIESIEDDRILRHFLSLIDAILRTNAFVSGGPETLAFKFDSARVPGLPKPLPWREIWVCSPRVEGVHLRGGPIARGGLRWSDRRDDFRTEVLGLVKAQMVKNSVIVPTGAKGGFYAKQLPDPAVDRDAWLTEGREAYKLFVRALLSVTDNLDQQGRIVPPADIVRHDNDDPYLVVAADKGTASFSDTANAIAEAHGFWLGDAFASGGSAGYDHKGMGITARGAWISVMRHFAELGTDVQTEAVTVAGVGDMSGDVFGNGMLQSQAIKLVAAFDHRHIFLDPAPDPATAWAERARLYALPRSSWADYNPELISAGGGVWPRTQKSIPLSDAVRQLLDIEATELDPVSLMSAILKSPVDLLWFGGIGTYIKGSSETNAAAGDRANDMLRVNGADVRSRVIGEGANLGMTQAGRIEYARRGGRLNADFIDNSAGVDTSDHEVNIKIALGAAERAGRLTRAARNQLLHAMTDEVAELVLADNRAQTLVLSVNETRAAEALESHARLIKTLEASGRLDPMVEGLPGPRELDARQQAGLGLTRPELAILMSYVKMDLKDALADMAPDQPGKNALLRNDLFGAFPPAMHVAHAADIAGHQLRRQIIATRIANLMVNRGGITFAHELAAEYGIALAQVATAFVAARSLFRLDQLWESIDKAEVPAAVSLTLHATTARVTHMLVRDLAELSTADPQTICRQLAPGLDRLAAEIGNILPPDALSRAEDFRKQLILAGAPDDISRRLTTLFALGRSAGVVHLAASQGLDEIATARAYTQLGERLGIDWAQEAVSILSTAGGWERLLAARTASSFDTARLQLIAAISGAGKDPVQMVDNWLATHEQAVTGLVQTIASARNSGKPTLAMLAHLASLAVHALQP